MNEYWSWVLGFIGIVGFILAGRKVWWSWYINIAAQIVWFAYAIVTEQYGFLITSILYAVVFTRNAYFWTRERNHSKQSQDEQIQKILSDMRAQLMDPNVVRRELNIEKRRDESKGYSDG